MSEFNQEQARFNMIEQQIRPWDVLDDRVLQLLAEVPREKFVPQRFKNMAFTDMALPLGSGQSMLPPRMEARILQALNIQADETVLEIGTGSGYLTALLASLGKHVYSVDIDPDMTRMAQANLQQQGLDNVTLENGDAARGWDAHQPYDVIAITGSVPILSDNFQHDLALGGRLLVIVGESPAMETLLITRIGPADWTRESLFETDLPPLRNAPKKEPFHF